jgi:competence protein ComEA
MKPLSGAISLSLGQKMNINQASARDMVVLPGVGFATARKIVAERESGGPFSSPEDLLRVPGIGPKALGPLLPLVTAGEED